jgi:hypothetical protein
MRCDHSAALHAPLEMVFIRRVSTQRSENTVNFIDHDIPGSLCTGSACKAAVKAAAPTYRKMCQIALVLT